MLTAVVHPSVISGTVTAPPSKSLTQRAFAGALLHAGQTKIINAGMSNDEAASLNTIRALGAGADFAAGTCIINSIGFPPAHKQAVNIFCGESGLALRLFAPIAALSAAAVNFSGSGSLNSRPMHFFNETFPQLGVQVSSTNGMLPIRMQGPMQPKNITVNGSLSSQYLSGLLFAFASATKADRQIEVTDLKSKPYIDITLEVMKQFGLVASHDSYRRFFISPKKQVAQELSFEVEGDWSSAAFLIVAAVIAGRLAVSSLRRSSLQADRAILPLLRSLGADLSVSGEVLTFAKTQLSGFAFDATDCPDLFPPLVALAANCEGISVIKGISRLAAKESDRAKTLQEVFGKLGIRISLRDDEMLIHGGTVCGGVVRSHHDHRIGMAAAIAALRASGAVTIEDAEAVGKSYPEFFNDLRAAGAAVEIFAT